MTKFRIKCISVIHVNFSQYCDQIIPNLMWQLTFHLVSPTHIEIFTHNGRIQSSFSRRKSSTIRPLKQSVHSTRGPSISRQRVRKTNNTLSIILTAPGPPHRGVEVRLATSHATRQDSFTSALSGELW